MPGATTFRGPLSAGVVEGALRGARERVLFVVPGDAGWTLPLYELALLTAYELPAGPELMVVTPEPRPLDLFGPIASEAVARCWTARTSALRGRRWRRRSPAARWRPATVA